jgi:hypothetical protein
MNPFLNLINKRLNNIYSYQGGQINLDFQDFKLIIYNPITLENCETLSTLINKFVVNIEIEDKLSFKMTFDSGSKLIVHIDDISYKNPEAMQLLGPDNLIAIWQ